MKKHTTNLFKQINTQQVQQLTTVVEETLAMEFIKPVSKIFTAADLWNIQRQGKTRIQRRFSF